MQPIPVDTSDFVQIRKNGQIYVDKTQRLYELITDRNRHFFFISRPRRFGKSLMISTLKAIFHGQRELFNGLAISRADYDWQVHPVIYLNMGFCAAENERDFLVLLANEMKSGLAAAGAEYDEKLPPAGNFANAIDFLAAHVALPVILIDEYDDPVARALKDTGLAERIRAHLATIYSQLKDRSGQIRFLMVTGVSKFTKMSIFSGFSNLTDISFDDHYATMLGFTESELDAYYSDYMISHAATMSLSMTDYRRELKRMYNGYRFWTYEGESVYNPVSINMTMANRERFFRCYWSDTGRPAMLMNFLKREDVLALEPDGKAIRASSHDFDVTGLDALSVKGVLFQAGYLTITDFNPMAEIFTLGIPDEEVRKDLAVLMASLS